MRKIKIFAPFLLILALLFPTISKATVAGDDLTSIYNITGPFDVIATGGTFRTQPNDVDCKAITNTSSNNLNIPNGAQVVKAFLFWAASYKSIDNTITLNGNQITAPNSNCHLIQNAFGTKYENFYGCYADVTNIVSSTGSGTYTLKDLTINNGSPWSNDCTVLGGWSLIVVYKDPNNSDLRYVDIRDGFKLIQNDSTSFTLSGFIIADNPTAKIISVVWEGDPNLYNNETIFINNQEAGSNLYDSNSTAIPQNNTYGVDIDLIDASRYVQSGDTSIQLAIQTGQDMVIVHSLTTVVKVKGVSGYVYEDPNGDGNMSDKVAISGATVKLYNSSGSQIATTTTDSNGYYYFGNIGDGDYYVVVDSKTVSPPEGFNSNYGLGDVWAEQTWVNATTNGNNYARGLCDTDADSSTAPSEVAGSSVCFGGAYGDKSDDASSLNTAEHKVRVHIQGGSVNDVDFGFSFNVVTNVNDKDDDSNNNRTCQGCLRQFIQNANAINGANYMRFVPAVPLNSGNWWTVTLNLQANSTNKYALPPITDAQTTVDGTAYSYQDGTTVRDTNSGSVSAPGTVGVSQTSLSPYNKPELEVNGNGKGSIFIVNASNVEIKKVAAFNTGRDTTYYPSAVYALSGSNISVLDNFLGARADGTIPSSSNSAMDGVLVRANANVNINHNYIAGLSDTGILLMGTGIIENNYISQTGRNDACADGISFEFLIDSPVQRNRNSVVARYNYVEKSAAYGIDSLKAPGAYTISENTITESGRGDENGNLCGDGNLGTTELGGIRIFGTGSLIEKNVIYNNRGNGVVVANIDSNTPSIKNTITQNIFYNNGGISIDLDQTHNTNNTNSNGDGVTPNDGQKNNSQQNQGLDYPIFTKAFLTGNKLHIEGYVGTPTSKIQETMTIEVYKADDDGNNNGQVISGDGLSVPHGEGHWYLGNCTTNSDGTFSCDITLPSNVSISPGDYITGTATDSTGNTSEFSANKVVEGGYKVSGYVYNDLNHSSTKEDSEGGLGSSVAVYVKLCQNGNVVQIATPDPNTGYYEFNNVLAGSYTIVESPDNNNNSCSAGAPQGWVPTTGISINLTVSGNISNINFGNYHGSKVTGYVFEDKGDGTANSTYANDAIFENSVEKGIEKVNVRACGDNSCSSVIDSTYTNADGSYTLWIPYTYNGNNVYIVETDLNGYISTGDSVGSTVDSNYLAPQEERNRLTYTMNSGEVKTDYNFGDVKKIQITPNQSYSVSAGNSLTIRHTINVNTPGAVALMLASNKGWEYTVYDDLDCNGEPDGGAITPNSGYFLLNGGNNLPIGTVCAVIKVVVPTNISDGTVEKLDVIAYENWSNTGTQYDDSDSVTDTITVSVNNRIRLEKAVRKCNDALNCTGSFTTKNEAYPCDIIEYKITFKNVSSVNYYHLHINDIIPDNTEFMYGLYNNYDKDILLHKPDGSEEYLNANIIGDTLELDLSSKIPVLKPGEEGWIQFKIMIKGNCLM